MPVNPSTAPEANCDGEGSYRSMLGMNLVLPVDARKFEARHCHASMARVNRGILRENLVHYPRLIYIRQPLIA